MPQETKSHEDHQSDSQLKQGCCFSPDDPELFNQGLRFATDYRGDVTINLTDGTVVQGFVFDYNPAESMDQSSIQIMPAKGGGRHCIPVSTISQVNISGRDMAAGKSFDTWIRKYVDKKIKGEAANIECESLDEDEVLD